MKLIAIESCQVMFCDSTIAGTAVLSQGKSIKTNCNKQKILLDGTQYNVSNCSNGTVQQASGIITFKSTSKNNVEGKKILRVGDKGQGVVNGVIPGNPPTPGSFEATFEIVDAGQVTVKSK